MNYIERNFSYKSAAEKTVRLIGGVSCGKIFNAYDGDDGLKLRFMPVNTGYTAAFSAASAGYESDAGDMFIVSGGGLYCKPSGEKAFSLIAENLARTPFFAEYDDVAIISDGVTDYTYTGGVLTSVAAPKALYGGCVHYSRLFGADLSDGYIVRWTAAGGYDDWTEGIRGSGWLRLPPEGGKILRLIPFGGKLIAVREKGLSVIRIYGETENFRINTSDTQTESVIPGTAAVCGGKLFFATATGLYSFNGSDIAREAEAALDGLGWITCGHGCGNFYFASLYLDGDNVLACIDCERGETSFCNISPDCIFGRGEAYLPSEGAVYRLAYPAYSLAWNSGYTDLGEHSKKFIKSVYIGCGEACDLTVESGGVSRIFAGVKGKVKVKMSGEKFRFKLNSEAEVNSFDVCFTV
ncbi:MAG: hypothetical protein LUD27_04955 [Clostridia bacterium]|nr:hypothetical protein [Clostridia bacterium]